MNFGLTTSGQVTRVLDGDTVEVEIRKTLRIRLLDCWAPETRTKNLSEKLKGIEAKNFLTGLAHGKEVVLEIPIEPDAKFGDSTSMGRVLGYIYIDGENVSTRMVDEGHATKTK